MKKIETFPIRILRCGSCGHVVTAHGSESAKASMLEHFVFSHSEAE